MEMYQEVASLLAANGSGVLLTIVATDGTTPRKAGSKMLVLADGSVRGTIGGGSLEKDMQRVALEVLADNQPRLVSFEERGQGLLACGGKGQVFFEPVAAGPQLCVVGNGHVGQALARMADGCGWQVRILDDRPPLDAGVGLFHQLEDYKDPFTGLGLVKEFSVLIASRSHETDLQALRAALQTDAAFIGLVGSRKKKAAFFEKLETEGISGEQLRRVESPVGLDIGAVTPAEIAVSIMAQLIGKRGKEKKF